ASAVGLYLRRGDFVIPVDADGCGAEQERDLEIAPMLELEKRLVLGHQPSVKPFPGLRFRLDRPSSCPQVARPRLMRLRQLSEIIADAAVVSRSFRSARVV